MKETNNHMVNHGYRSGKAVLCITTKEEPSPTDGLESPTVRRHAQCVLLESKIELVVLLLD
jgi:hypothetical protein